ncbi:MAG TPA: protein kinase, partial [Blastocatellia bacterium]|nr:protein kinase [Blastocatellia bacterium]
MPIDCDAFEQEAQAAGALNHPNILAVYDVGTHDGAPYVVSELLEGETLRERLNGSALPPRKAIDYALQIARGLAAAHGKGIVHRDLKPENLFIIQDGRIKILDFGLAKLVRPQFAGEVYTQAATLLARTDPGTILGTVGYMSPEQVRGALVDQRTDIFAFGAILYEMLSGKTAFHRQSKADTISAILKEDPPDLSTTEHNLTPALARIMRHCLEKNPEERFHSASDLAFALEALSASTETSTQIEARPALGPGWMKSRERLAWMATGILFLSLLALLPFVIAHFRESPAESRAVRSFILPPEKSSFNFTDTNAGSLSISPDGRRLTFVAPAAEGKNLLWVRSLDALSAQALTGTEGASYPFWSPDSRFIGFFVDADGKLKKIEAAGGPTLTLCDAPLARGGTWNRD